MVYHYVLVEKFDGGTEKKTEYLVKKIIEYDWKNDRKSTGKMTMRGHKEIECLENQKERLKFLRK